MTVRACVYVTVVGHCVYDCACLRLCDSGWTLSRDLHETWPGGCRDVHSVSAAGPVGTPRTD